MKKQIIKQGDNEVILHQDVARIRGTLTPIQSKSMLSLLKRANELVSKDPNIKNFTISTKTFLNDIQNKDTAGIATIIKKLHKILKNLAIVEFGWGTEKELEFHLFMQGVKINENEISFVFTDYIREHIKPLSNVLIIKDFELIQSFKSEYARQLYKHLMMWEQKQSCYLSIKDFKDFLGVPNTKAYNRLDNLKRKVLDVAVKEINQKCPYMDLKYFNKKEGRKVIGFNFGWFNKMKKDKTPVENEDKKPAVKVQKIDKNILEYVGKTVYFQGFDWKILSINIEKNSYVVVCQEVDDYRNVKGFEMSLAQIKSAK